MAINKDFTFADKGDGLFGTLDYTWDFTSHWPILTLEYLENMSGINLSDKKSTVELANVELKKVMRLSKLFLFKQLKRSTQFKLEYFVAKDNDRLNEVLEYQVHIFEAGFADGGWISMYETTDEHGIKSSIGMAAEEFIHSSLLGIKTYNYMLAPDLIRDGTY